MAGQGRRLVSVGLGLALVFMAFVSVVDQAAGEEVVRGVLSVRPGYSFVSLPCVNTSFTASSLLDALGDAAKSISYYDPLIQSYVTYDRSLARFGIQGDFPIQPDIGYIVYSAESCSTSIYGIDAAERTIHLRPGYNLVGWSSPVESDPVTAFVKTSNEAVRSVSGFDESSQQYVTYDVALDGFGIPQPDFQISKGHAYFVFSTELCALKYDDASEHTVTSPRATDTSTTSTFQDAFLMRGTLVRINALYYCPTHRSGPPINYQPNGWSILQDLGVNLIRVSGGAEGDLVHFNMDTHPSEWAHNLNDFLAQADTHGMKVIFVTLGNDWGTLFNIVCPEPYTGIAGTPIDKAKTMIDQLAGNNALAHNFIADPRIFAWSVANEVDLDNSITLDWCIQMLDHIRSKGAKAFVSAPYDSSASSDWVASMGLYHIEPMLRGHVDYFQIHIYHPSVAARAQREARSVYTAVYNDFNYCLKNYLIEGRGNVPLENLILGEFGIWHGYGEWADDLSLSFTDKSVNEYYEAVYQSARDLGIRNIINFDCFAQKLPDGTYTDLAPLWSVDVDGSYVSAKTSVMQKYYLLNGTS